MADVTMDDINIVLNKFPVFAQEVRLEAANRRVDELEAEKAAAPACDCQKTKGTIECPSYTRTRHRSRWRRRSKRSRVLK